MTHTCKCKSESERLHLACMKVSRVIKKWFIGSQIWCSSVQNNPEFDLIIEGRRIQFDSVGDIELWVDDLEHKIALGRHQ